MAAVLTYWQASEDEVAFRDFLHKSGDVWGVPLRIGADMIHYSRAEDIVPKRITYVPGSSDSTWIGLKEDIHKMALVPYEFEGGRYVGVSHMQSCVIRYDRGQYQDGIVTLSNLCAYWEYPDPQRPVMVRKGPEFIRWANKVFSWVRRRTSEKLCDDRGYYYRATKAVKSGVMAGKLRVVPF
jgi:hypothetical protein